jgi:hypothetical protein
MALCGDLVPPNADANKVLNKDYGENTLISEQTKRILLVDTASIALLVLTAFSQTRLLPKFAI